MSDEIETLAQELHATENRGATPGMTCSECRRTARIVASSDWLAERDAQKRREGAMAVRNAPHPAAPGGPMSEIPNPAEEQNRAWETGYQEGVAEAASLLRRAGDRVRHDHAYPMEVGPHHCDGCDLRDEIAAFLRGDA